MNNSPQNIQQLNLRLSTRFANLNEILLLNSIQTEFSTSKINHLVDKRSDIRDTHSKKITICHLELEWSRPLIDWVITSNTILNKVTESR